MNALLQALSDPGNMTRQQWLLLIVMLVVVVGVLYLVWRLHKLTQSGTRKEPYVPNIGRRRLEAEAERARKR
ncbi:MAG: hypothetical protein LBF16_04310 [Pseudomonadales bacterium]|jgi:uncharacterized protein HemY|nr:hypothetical protein [Pseudomonadales bacterium]